MAASGLTVVPLHKHHRLWFEDGSVILFSNVHFIYFRLHRSVLSLHSEVFRMILALPSEAEHNKMIEGCPVVHLHDDGIDPARFFGLLYDGGKDPFFQLEEEIDFRTVRAMLILSSKYEVQHIREAALRRLRVWFPSDLAGWDKFYQSRVDAKYGILKYGILVLGPPLVSPQLEDSIAVINMARKFDLPDLLPIAFYRCSCMPLADLLQSVDYGTFHEDAEELSRDDLGKALHGADELDKLIAPRLFILVNFIPNPECQRRSKCKQTAHTLLRDVADLGLSSRISLLDTTALDAALARYSTTAVPALCSPCKQDLRGEFDAKRREVWEQLERIYSTETVSDEGD